MDTLQTILTIIGAVVALTLAFIGIITFVRGSYSKARIEALREDNNDLRDRVGDTEAELQVCNAGKEALAVRVSTLQDENALLKNLALQHANVDELKTAISEHDARVAVQWERVVTSLEALQVHQAERSHADGPPQQPQQ